MTTSITITRAQLHELFKSVTPFAATREDLPILCSVLVETHSDYVTALATDRFRAAMSRIQIETAPEFRVLIDTEDVKTILSTYKTAGSAGLLPITLTADGDTLTLMSVNNMTIQLLDETGYPKLLGILRNAVNAEPGCMAQAFHPRLIGALKDVGAVYKKDIVKIRNGTTYDKPAIFTIGENFIAMLMPRAKPGGFEHPELDEWRGFLGGAT